MTPGSLAGRSSPSGRAQSPSRAVSPSLYVTTLRLMLQEAGQERPSFVVSAVLEEAVLLVLLSAALSSVRLIGDRRRSAPHASLVIYHTVFGTERR